MSTQTAPQRDLSNLPKVVGAHKPKTDSRRSNLIAVLGSAVTGATVGYIAIAIGWAITEALDVSDGRSLGPIALYFAILGAVYGMIVSAWSDVASRIFDRALIRAAMGAFVGATTGALAGAVSQVLFEALQQSDDPGALRFYLLRALAWAVFGMGIGIAGGIAERSMRKSVNGLLGGLIGGAIGGVLFQWLSLNVDSAGQARLVSLAAVGISIGAAIGIVEVARRQAWLRVVAGGMAGKEFILYHATTNIGSSPKCEITLIKDPGAAPFHARIDDQSGRRVLTPYDGAAVSVNGGTIRTRNLRSGDQIVVGATTLEYQERDAS